HSCPFFPTIKTTDRNVTLTLTLTKMNEQPVNKLQPTDAPKLGFFQRILTKVDTAMKTKADEQAKNSQCCSGDDKGKGGKCC
ncbi:MAG: hypothetical protein ACI8ZW_001717, partial [Yoonia sp.]